MYEKRTFFTWVLLKWTKTPIFAISLKMLNRSIIRMMFDGYNM